MSKKHKPLSPEDTGQIIEKVKLLLTTYQETGDLKHFISAQKVLCSIKVQRAPREKGAEPAKDIVNLEDLEPIM